MSHTVIVLSNPNLMRSLSLHEIAKLTQRERTKSLKSAVKIWILSLQCSYWINFSSPVFTSLIHVRKAFLSHTFFNVYVCMSPDSSSQVRNSDMFVWKQLETSGKHLEPVTSLLHLRGTTLYLEGLLILRIFKMIYLCLMLVYM